ncbi:MAG: DUF1080 domain-containing protein, partial [Sedimentisphaerales bacterium]|nr:DUF1080 domain-containing protein [Sedimentisphaerales bacterium]
MKKSVAPLFVLIVILSCLLWSDQLVQAGTLQSSQYYTWGIGSEALHIPEGSIITDAVLTIEGAGNIIQNSGDFFYVHLLDEPGIGWKEWKDHNDQNEFMGNGVNLTPVIENGNLIYSFNAINDDGSWIWEIFEKPFQFDLLDSVVSLPSSILELIDFAGAGDSFGIGIDGDAEGYGFNQIRLDLTVRPFEQGGEEKTLSGSLFMEDFNDNTLSSWTIVDQGTNLGPSNWTVINGELVQTTHIYSNPTAPGTLRKEGTFLKCNYGADWKDYQISLKLRSLGMNDCGVMFRVSDDNNYYRFNWNYQSNYSRLVKVSGGIATLLAETAQGYVQGKDYDLMIALSGSQMRIYVDGELRLAADDNTIQSGTVGLYCWGNAPGTYFDNVTIEEGFQAVQQTQQSQIFLTEMFNNTSLSGWTVVDQGSELGPSDWSVSNGVLSQTTHIYSAPTAPSTLRKEGTYIQYDAGRDWTDYEVSCQMRSAGLNDYGFMFRVQDENNYYRFSWNNQAGYSRLIKVINGTASQLASRPEGFVLNRDYQVKVVSFGSELRVYVDNILWLSATDATFDSGTIGLYCWGNAPGTFFDNVLVTETTEVEDPGSEDPVELIPPDYSTNFNNASLSGWTVVDQGSELGPSDWSVSNGVLSQTTHIYSAPTAPSTLRKEGTYIQYNAGRGWADYEVSCQMRSAGLNDYG